MYKPTRKWRTKEPVVYYLRDGAIPLKRSKFRYFFLTFFFVIAASAAAIFQFSDQVERIIFKKGNPQVASIQAQQQLPQIRTPYNSELLLIEAPQIDSKLQEKLTDWVASHRGQDWSIVVQGLDGDKRRATVRPSSWYVPASVYKVMMTYSLFKRYNIDQLNQIYLTVDKDQVSLGTCVDVMLRYSNNACGEAVGKKLGWANIDKDLHDAGYVNTFTNRKDSMFTTADDAASFMADLYNGKLVNSQERDWIIKILQDQRLRDGIPKGCEGCSVADKTGDLGNVRHDVGIVQDKGQTYVLSIFTSGAPYSEIADITKQINDYMTNKQ